MSGPPSNSTDDHRRAGAVREVPTSDYPPRPPRARRRTPRAAWIGLGSVVVIVGLLAILVATGVLPLFRTQQSPQPCPPCTPPPLAIGPALPGTCAGASTFAVNGCAGGEFTYSLVIESSVIQLEDILFHVEISAGGNYFATGTSGFSILDVAGSVLAQYGATGGLMAMSVGWENYAAGITPTTILLTTDTLLIDMGTANPHSQGYLVFANLTAPYTGYTETEELP
jgi:hypothetical protein